jgi:tRNA (mo5U34)-methyltransferase
MAKDNLQQFQQQLDGHPQSQWLERLLPAVTDRLRPDSQRNFPGWLNALAALPEQRNAQVSLHTDTITTQGTGTHNDPHLCEALKQLMPWRKGPFCLHGIHIDTEWRCDWKWRRIAPHIDLRDLTVLDVGCGNGYYSLRMLGAGAKHVVGMDTSLLYWSQFQAVTRFTDTHRATVLPLSVECLLDHPARFDVIFSMGVLYHRRQPVDHLQLLCDSLPVGGKLVLETLILHGGHAEALIPPGRYANMRNVWSVPTLPLLMSQLSDSGFSRIRCVDINRTTIEEQRKTSWMTFNSLADALNESDPSLTAEGHPGPLRAVIIAEK